MNKIEIPQEVIAYAIDRATYGDFGFFINPDERLQKIEQEIQELTQQKAELLHQIEERDSTKERFKKFLKDIGHELE